MGMYRIGGAGTIQQKGNPRGVKCPPRTYTPMGPDMQTFLPYSNYTLSARHLDRARLGKQRLECLQIAKAISDPAYGWQNHPAVEMWRGNLRALYWYSRAIVTAWVNRGYKDGGTLSKIEAVLGDAILDGDIYPHWLRFACGVTSASTQDALCHWPENPLCASHRAALLFKNPAHYGQFGWIETPRIDYYWPTRHSL